MDSIDIRDKLPRKAWEIGRRLHTPKFLTLHYNGPIVPLSRQSGQGLINQLIIDAQYQMRPGGLGSPEGGDGLQYHYVVGSDCVVYQCRDDNSILWHCANKLGNAESLAIHVPIGFGQSISDQQWSSITSLFEKLMSDYNIPSTAVRGHQEWSLNLCPGPYLMGRLTTWRKQQVSHVLKSFYRVKRGIAVVRTSPEVLSSNVATNPFTHEPFYIKVDTPDAVFAVDAIVTGKWAGSGLSATNQWVHREDGIGFVHAAAVEKV